jgi:hypothetical protein
MTETVLSPPIAADVELTDFQFMPLEILRLRRSKAWLICKRRPELAFYMINLWTAAWHERPAGSLEDDDDVLADLSMCPPKEWPKVKEDALRGWIKCDDGRLYHPVVVEKVRDAWKSKMTHAYDRECGRLRKAAERAGKLKEFVPPTFDQWETLRVSNGQVWMSNGRPHKSNGHAADVHATSKNVQPKTLLRDSKGISKGYIQGTSTGQVVQTTDGAEGRFPRGIDPHEAFRLIQATYPQFSGRQDWLAAQHHCGVLIDRSEAQWADLTAGVERYAEFVNAGGVSGPQYVMTPAKFFSAADKPWAQLWDPPPPAKRIPKTPEERAADQASEDASELLRLQSQRAELGIPDFRDPYSVDTPASYETAMRTERAQRGLR